MNTNLLALASGLSDQDLLARIAALAGKEREASVELVAHLAELDTRSSLYAAHSYGSLFTYCTEVLRLSEDAACNRIYAARACRRFPVILDALASGALSLTSVRMLSPHLTPENHEVVLARASGRRRRDRGPGCGIGTSTGCALLGPEAARRHASGTAAPLRDHAAASD
jgi:hypothetical protein